MKTEILQIINSNLDLAASEILDGGVVAFPTETVYGLGANALNPQAVAKIFAAKNRPPDNPLIVHLASVDDISTVADTTGRTELIKKASCFMPGPLTVILKKKDVIPQIVSGGLDTVAVRVPMHDVALAFIKRCGVPLAAPSANSSTKPSPTAASHVHADLNGKIRYILDGGATQIGIESTIIDLSGDIVRLLRPGGIPLSKLQTVFKDIKIIQAAAGKEEERAICPGTKYRHYAPNAEVYVCSSDITPHFAALSKTKKVRVLSLTPYPFAMVFSSEDEYASRLYGELRRADADGIEVIICQSLSGSGLGHSVNNRLYKAAGGKTLD